MCADAEWELGTTTLYKDALIASMIGWFVLRVIGIVLEGFILFAGANSESGWVGQLGMNIFQILIFTFACSLLYSPIMNMNVSAKCPQIVTSYYSYQVATVFSFLAFVLVIDFGIITFYVVSNAEVAQAANSAFGFLWMLARVGKDKSESTNDKQALLGYAMMAVPASMLAIILIAIACKFYEIVQISWSVVFSLQFSWKVRFPAFSLSAHLNAFHIIATLLTVSDYLNMSLKVFMRLTK